jgi:hypothetical protein
MSKVGPKSGESDLGMTLISTQLPQKATRSAAIVAKTWALVQSCHSVPFCPHRAPRPTAAYILHIRMWGRALGEKSWQAWGAALCRGHILGGGTVNIAFAQHKFVKIGIIGVVCAALAGCGQMRQSVGGTISAGGPVEGVEPTPAQVAAASQLGRDASAPRSTVWDLFSNADNPNSTVAVNRYIWNASLDVLNFLPIESVDPFTGVIVTGYGTPPGGGQSYRATVLVQDPALDARSLKLSLQTRGGGAVAPATLRAVEDAILSRARQLRIADSGL